MPAENTKRRESSEPIEDEPTKLTAVEPSDDEEKEAYIPTWESDLTFDQLQVVGRACEVMWRASAHMQGDDRLNRAELEVALTGLQGMLWGVARLCALGDALSAGGILDGLEQLVVGSRMYPGPLTVEWPDEIERKRNEELRIARAETEGWIP